MARETGRRLPTRLGEIHVRQRGDGPPAVLWHSLFVDSRSWRRIEDRLANDRTLIIIDGPGHGQSASPAGRFTLDDCAEAGVEVLEALGLDSPVDWVGNAWGGHVGIVFAAAYPARCSTLVTIGTPVEGLRGWARAKSAVMVALYRRVGPWPPLTNGVVEAMLAPRTRLRDPEAVQLVVDTIQAADRQGMYWVLKSVMLGRPDLDQELRRVSAPTLFIVGADDPMWTPAQAAAFTGGSAERDAAPVPDVRHLAPFEAPDAVADLVTGFWRARPLSPKEFHPASTR